MWTQIQVTLLVCLVSVFEQLLWTLKHLMNHTLIFVIFSCGLIFIVVLCVHNIVANCTGHIFKISLSVFCPVQMIIFFHVIAVVSEIFEIL